MITILFFQIGNLDEKVSERVLYDILIEAGRVVDLHLPQDKDSGHHKGFAFAEYETEEIANYALRLFSGVVYLCNKLVKFGVINLLLIFYLCFIYSL